eukprot:304655_1
MAKKRKLDENVINGLDIDAKQNIENKLIHNDGIITLNIGGTKYQTTITTLCSNSNCIFAAMFSGKYLLKASEDGSYFVDRNGEHFRYILDFLRTNQCIIPKSDYLLKHLYAESEFYQLPSLKIQLLMQQFSSNILTRKNMKYIQKWFDEYHMINNLNLMNSRLVFEGNNLVFNENGGIGEIKVLQSLLMIFKSENHSFGIYLVDNRGHNYGFSFFLDNDNYYGVEKQKYKHLADHQQYNSPDEECFCYFSSPVMIYHIPMNVEQKNQNEEMECDDGNYIEITI